MPFPRLGCVALCLLPLTAPPAVASAPGDDVKLILFITVDQLRGDMLDRFEHRFGPDGFRRLMREGVHYRNAHYRHGTTFTAAGHATLVTGGNPPEHGMAGNNWVDPDTQERVYAVEDDRYVVHGLEMIPGLGTSPRNLTCSTIGDEMVMASAGRSRVFGVSIKDRGAIIPAGHLGDAYWYKGGRFVTSTYYGNELPSWVRAWNDAGHVDAYEGTEWTLLHDRDTYVARDRDDRPYEILEWNLGRTFPHPIASSALAPVAALMPYTPMGDVLTVEFVRALMDEERPGEGDAVDMLSVALSATDYIGHSFGPYSLEAEDNLRRLDQTIATLLALVDERVGLDRTVVVLSADHGIDAAPEYRRELAGEEARATTAPAPPRRLLARLLAARHDTTRMIAEANAALRMRFSIDVDLVTEFWNPALFIDGRTALDHDLDLAEIEACVADTVLRRPGVAFVATRSDILAGRVPPGPIADRIVRGFHPRRSGHVVIVQQPSWFLYHNATSNAAMHGSPYVYDTHVPIIVRGPGVEPARIIRQVGPEDIASSLALGLDLPLPSGSIGTPLPEVVSGLAGGTPDHSPSP